MIKSILTAVSALTIALPASAQDETAEGAPSPNQIVDAAAAQEWVPIPAEQLLVMTLAPDDQGNKREVVIQLMPAPFSQGWVENIRTLARAKWYDGISINRVQDNYVVQWGDPNYDNPEAEGEAKPLPEGLRVMGEDDYTAPTFLKDASAGSGWQRELLVRFHIGGIAAGIDLFSEAEAAAKDENGIEDFLSKISDRYSNFSLFSNGWPVAGEANEGVMSAAWPVHCYGMVGVGRGYSPDTGSGAELYTVIGHAPRHLDRNIALVGRIISGMEHLSSLPRGSGALGFYTEEEQDKRTPILSVRVASDIEQFPQPSFEYLSTESESFAKYAEARANRRDPFFIHSAGGADICNIPVPVRRVATD